VSLEDAGCCQKGEIGAFYDSVDTTDQGRFPVNTDGGQISAGQPVGGAGGFRQVIEAARQVMGRATPGRQARPVHGQRLRRDRERDVHAHTRL
jgi:acetyl-CoA acetyltransferase